VVTRCNGPVPGWNRTRNRTGNLDPLLTLSQTALLQFEVLPDLSQVRRGLTLALPGLLPVLPGAPRCSQACRQCSQVLPCAPKVLSGAPRCSQTYHNHSHGTPVPVIRDPSYSKGWPEYPPRVSYSPDIEASKFTLHILSDTPGGSQ